MLTKKSLMTMAIAALLGAASTMVTAAPHGAGGNAGGHSAGGMSAGHISSQGMQNSNGANAEQRVTGLDRAEERMSDEGLEHSQAREAKLKRKSPPQAAAKEKHSER
jgi:hypothetical protein